jgi:hypothetical protein
MTAADAARAPQFRRADDGSLRVVLQEYHDYSASFRKKHKDHPGYSTWLTEYVAPLPPKEFSELD